MFNTETITQQQMVQRSEIYFMGFIKKNYEPPPFPLSPSRLTNDKMTVIVEIKTANKS